MTRSRAPEIVAGLITLGLALLLFSETVGVAPEGVEAARNPVWYPRFLLALAGLASAGLVLRGVFGRGMETPQPSYPRLAGVTAVLAVYFWFFESVGFLATSILLIPALAFLIGYRRLAATVLVSLLFCVGLWYLFADLFVVRPPGPGVDTFLQMLTGG